MRSRRTEPRRKAHHPASVQGGGGAFKGSARSIQYPETLFMLPPETEYIRLWRHVIFGTGTCISMIEGYTGLNMPGDVLNDLYVLRDRLNSVISKHEAKHGRKAN